MQVKVRIEIRSVILISRHHNGKSGYALPDMDYFLNDDELDDEFGEDGFYIF